MSHTTNVTRSSIAITAAAVTAAGVIATPIPAAAKPMLPLAPVCEAFKLGDVGGGLLEVHQDNGTVMQVPVTGSQVGPGRAMHAIPGRTAGTFGNAYGGLNGRDINFTVNWDQGPGAGSTNTYTGRIADDGISTGITKNNTGAQNSWRSSLRHGCVDAPAKPAENKPPEQVPPPKPTVTVLQPADVYDAPDGNGNRIGDEDYFLNVNEKYELVEPCRDNWCHLVIPSAPGGQGWVYQDGYLQGN